MPAFRHFIEQLAFHLPVLHDWLAERDDLRRKTAAMNSELQILESKYDSVLSRLQELEEFKKALWMPPGHFYSPIPAIKELEANRGAIFSFPRSIDGIELNEDVQLDLLNQFGQWYKEQPFTPEKVPGRRYFFDNPNFSYADAIVLYGMMRHLRPRRIIEVGSGYSSCAMLDVNELFFGGSIACTFIDPYPSLLLTLLKDEDRSRVRVISQKVQDAPIEVFRELESGDILFIDSSHVTKTGSDVNYLMFKILPLVNAGVHIHFHDIFYPFEYPPEFAFEGRAWNEAYLLRAFLSYNRAFEIRFFTTYLITYFRERFETEFPLFLHCTGGSIWLRKTCA